MKMLSIHRASLAVAVALWFIGTSPVPAAPPGNVLASGNFIHVVAHLDKTIAFYHGVLGLDQAPLGDAPPSTPKFAPSGPVAKLYDVPADTTVGAAVFRLPVMGVGLEFAEFRNVKQGTVRPRPQDPGASALVLTVQHLDPILLRAHAAHVPIMTTGGVPIPAGDEAPNARMVVLSDPDGYYVELIERSEGTGGGVATPAGNVLRAGLMLSIGDTDGNAHYYRDLVGIPMQIDDAFAPNPALASAFGVARAQFRHSIAMIRGSQFKYDFVEWKGMGRRVPRMSVHDHGAGVLRLVVSNVDTYVSNLRSAGIAVDSRGNGVVQMTPVLRACILTDPNGLFIEPVPRLRLRGPPTRAPVPTPRAP